MLASCGKPLIAAFVIVTYLTLGLSAAAQTSGTVEGVVKDPSGAVVSSAAVEIHNPVSHFDRSTTTDSERKFRFTNVPFNPYHLSVTASVTCRGRGRAFAGHNECRGEPESAR
jgi:hypothetical protein